jgi:hypothetical protein
MCSVVPALAEDRGQRVGRVLTGAVGLLKKPSRGYGIWNYFDYRANHLYNPNFLRGLHGCESRGVTRCEESPYPRWLVPARVSGRRWCRSCVGMRPALRVDQVSRCNSWVCTGLSGFSRTRCDAEVPPPRRTRGTAELRPEPTAEGRVVIENWECARRAHGVCVWALYARASTTRRLYGPASAIHPR